MERMIRALVPVITAVMVFSAWLSPYNDEVNAGNKAMEQKKYTEAMEHYKKAREHADTGLKRAILDYNMGDAQYMAGDYDSAIEYFKKTAALPDREIAKKSWFNIGNSYVKKKMKREAADAYARALELDPEYDKTRKNLEYLRKKDKSDDKKDNQQQGDDGQGKGGGKDDKSGSSGKQGGKEMTPEEMQRIFESMKKSPVRKQDNGKNGRRMLEKYW